MKTLLVCSLVLAFVFAASQNNLASISKRFEIDSKIVYRTRDYETTKDDEFDYFMLSTQWPGTVCKHLTPYHTDLSKDIFTIHGLWPSNYDGSYPQDCYTEAKPFNASQIQSLLPDLRAFWTDYKAAEPSFWEHEWNKHGTCASIIQSLKNELSYFGSTLKVLSILDIPSKLAKHGIVPDASKPYSVASIKEALNAELGGAPTITCSNGYIGELRLCLNKNMTVFNCGEANPLYMPNIENRNFECSTVIIPPVKHHKF